MGLAWGWIKVWKWIKIAGKWVMRLVEVWGWFN